MNNKIIEFTNEHFGKVRAINIDGDPWFVGKDIVSALGYANGSRDINRHVDEEDRRNYRNGTSEINNRGITIINESGLYSLILSSKLASAKMFKRWVTSDILPSIRKHGTYLTDEVLDEILQSPEFAFQLFKELEEEKNKVDILARTLVEIEPKARYCESVLECGKAVPITLIAKDYGYTAAAFNSMLHGFKVQFKVGGIWFLYKEHANNGYTKTKTIYINPKETAVHTYWTQKGRLFLYEFLKHFNILPLLEI